MVHIVNYTPQCFQLFLEVLHTISSLDVVRELIPKVNGIQFVQLVLVLTYLYKATDYPFVYTCTTFPGADNIYENKKNFSIHELSIGFVSFFLPFEPH